jgi:hypothetical protein
MEESMGGNKTGTTHLVVCQHSTNSIPPFDMASILRLQTLEAHNCWWSLGRRLNRALTCIKRAHRCGKGSDRRLCAVFLSEEAIYVLNVETMVIRMVKSTIDMFCEHFIQARISNVQ